MDEEEYSFLLCKLSCISESDIWKDINMFPDMKCSRMICEGSHLNSSHGLLKTPKYLPHFSIFIQLFFLCVIETVAEYEVFHSQQNLLWMSPSSLIKTLSVIYFMIMFECLFFHQSLIQLWWLAEVDTPQGHIFKKHILLPPVKNCWSPTFELKGTVQMREYSQQ